MSFKPECAVVSHSSNRELGHMPRRWEKQPRGPEESIGNNRPHVPRLLALLSLSDHRSGRCGAKEWGKATSRELEFVSTSGLDLPL